MNSFLEKVIKPVIAAHRPKSIVEIGAFSGLNTAKLLDYCKYTDSVCHVIDPLPQFDVESMKALYGEKFVLHQDLSLAALLNIEYYDMVLIDGDHNWYTVYHELKQISEMAEKTGQFPIVFLHDTAWPYARRDMYYDPENIPEAFRHPYDSKGIVPGSSELVEGGANTGFNNATHEYGEQNGVLTAIEDFMKQSSIPLRLHLLQANFGLGILLPADSQLNPIISFIVDTSGM
ncbi:class I SAM-dependent methyltransferase [Paenibacillus enshidis]|uniref:Class I SAM-dependent methyltransferase n=1 Tax=Paenibacillus enshidis TaxID=1458439 RepID=A0ABV5AXZ8_9BACL